MRLVLNRLVTGVLLTAVLSIPAAAKDKILKNESEITKDDTYKIFLPGKMDRVYIEGFYRNGQKMGRHRTYDLKTREVLEICHYHLGERHGLCKKYYPKTGQLYKVVQFFAGVPHGEYKVYHPNGQLQSKVRYVYGLKQGEESIYNDKGRLIETIKYKDGKAIKIL